MNHSIPRAEQVNGVLKFGRNTDVDGAEYITPLGLLPEYFAIGAAGAVYISSDNAGDTAIDITIEYLDDNGDEKSVTTTLSGKTFVDTGITATFVNRAYVSSQGDTLAGTVYISSSNTDVGVDGIPDDLSTVYAVVTTADQQTAQAVYQVPTGKIADVYGWQADVLADGGAGAKLVIRLAQLQLTGSWRTIEASGLNSPDGPHIKSKWPFTLSFPAGTILAVEVLSASAANNDVTAEFFLALRNA